MKNVKGILLLIVSSLIVFSCEKNENEGDSAERDGECGITFGDKEASKEFEVSYSDKDFKAYFTQYNYYEVTVAGKNDRTLTIKTDKEDLVFTKDLVVSCSDEGHETNVRYDDVEKGYKLLVQHDGSSYTINIYNTNMQGQVDLKYFGPADLSLLIGKAGTYAIKSISPESAVHQRGTVIINSDGSINFDNDILLGEDDIKIVYDRLSCCQRIHIETKKTGILNIYWKGDNLKNIDKIEYQSNIYEF